MTFIDRIRSHDVLNTSRFTDTGPLPDRLITDYRLSQKRNIFAGEMYSALTIWPGRMGRWSFMSWFDVNWKTIVTLSFPMTLTF